MSKNSPEVASSGYDYKIRRLSAIDDEATRLSKLYKKSAQLGIDQSLMDCIERQISEDYSKIESLAGDMTIYEEDTTK